jgi:hypothetical protein
VLAAIGADRLQLVTAQAVKAAVTPWGRGRSQPRLVAVRTGRPENRVYLVHVPNVTRSSSTPEPCNEEPVSAVGAGEQLPVLLAAELWALAHQPIHDRLSLSAADGADGIDH